MDLKRAIAALAVAASCAGAISACGDDDDDSAGGGSGTTGQAAPSSSAPTGKIDESKPPVNVAFIAMKIPGLDLYTPYLAGAQAAADKINAEGGFGGRRLVVDTCNSMAQPATATSCAHKTLAKDPIAEFGCDIAWTTSGLQVYAKAKVPSFNCVNTEEDFTNPYSFGISPAGQGERTGTAKFLCEKADVQKVAVLSVDVPSQRAQVPAHMKPTLDACGKELAITFVALTAADYTPVVQKMLKSDPDFVVLQLPGSVQMLQAYKALQQYSFPADHTSASTAAFGYEATLKQAGDLMDGAHSALGFASWGDTSRPDVQAYKKAMEGADWDWQDPGPQGGYHSVMWFYTAGKAIGFDKLNAQTLVDYTNKANGVQMPLSRELVNPGPEGAPQVKQPYVQIVQWKDGKLNVVREGTEDGWVNAFDAPTASGS